MDNLDYEFHLENNKRLLGFYAERPNKERVLADAKKQANYDHSIWVFDPLRDWIGKATEIVPKLGNDEAQYYMLHGAGRRLSWIFSAYREITHIAHPNREDPLSHDEQLTVSREINVLYINLRGVLDNFAWCFLYEKQPELVDKIHPNDIGLFSSKFRKQCVVFSEIEDEIKTHDDWNVEVKERRDPVAHRIPFYVPQILETSEDVERYQDLNSQFWDRTTDFKFDEAGEIFDQMNAVGTFLPIFVHHPEKPPIPIYPTIPKDMAHLIRIGNAIEEGLLKN